MKTILAKIEGTNWVGTTAEEELEVEYDLTDAEIDKIVWDWAVEYMMLETDWEEISEK